MNKSGRVKNAATSVLLSVLSGYRNWVSPSLGENCRFYPSCSAYAEQAIGTRGPIKGLQLALSRLLKCHPLHPGGYDPVES